MKLFKLCMSVFLVTSFFSVQSAGIFDVLDKGVEAVEAYLAEHPDGIHETEGHWNSTALMIASLNGRTDIVLALIKAKAVVDAVNQSRETALMQAARKGHTNIVLALHQAGADINIQNNNGNTALIHAISDSRKDTALALINAGSDLSTIGGNALREASSQGLDSVVQTLLVKGVDVNAADSNQETALMNAAYNGRANTLSMLLKYKADMMLEDNEKSTAFDKVLLGIKQRDGNNSLLRAAFSNRSHNRVKQILQHWNQCNQIYLESEKNIGIFDRIQLFFSDNILLRHSVVSLFLTVFQDKPEVLQYLLQEQSIPKNIFDLHKHDFFYYARRLGHQNIGNILLSTGANPFYKDKNDKKYWERGDLFKHIQYCLTHDDTGKKGTYASCPKGVFEQLNKLTTIS